MRDRYHLKAVRDDELLAATSTIVGEGNQVTADLLAHLAELDERQLYAELGFPSLWAYCVGSLKLCESSAGRRIAAARVCRAFPEAFALVASGDLHLSASCSLKARLNRENAAALFEMCRGKSARRVDELLAARFPKPDVRDSIRRLPAPRATTPDAGSAPTRAQPDQAKIVRNVAENASEWAIHTSQALPGEPLLARSFEATSPTPVASARIEPLSADRFGVHFTADSEFRVARAGAGASGSPATER